MLRITTYKIVTSYKRYKLVKSVKTQDLLFLAKIAKMAKNGQNGHYGRKCQFWPKSQNCFQFSDCCFSQFGRFAGNGALTRLFHRISHFCYRIVLLYVSIKIGFYGLIEKGLKWAVLAGSPKWPKMAYFGWF